MVPRNQIAVGLGFENPHTSSASFGELTVYHSIQISYFLPTFPLSGKGKSMNFVDTSRSFNEPMMVNPTTQGQVHQYDIDYIE